MPLITYEQAEATPVSNNKWDQAGHHTGGVNKEAVSGVTWWWWSAQHLFYRQFIVTSFNYFKLVYFS